MNSNNISLFLSNKAKKEVFFCIFVVVATKQKKLHRISVMDRRLCAICLDTNYQFYFICCIFPPHASFLLLARYFSLMFNKRSSGQRSKEEGRGGNGHSFGIMDSNFKPSTELKFHYRCTVAFLHGKKFCLKYLEIYFHFRGTFLMDFNCLNET